MMAKLDGPLKHRRCCVIAEHGSKASFLSDVLTDAEGDIVSVVDRMAIRELAKLNLDFLLVDADQFEFDPLETLRMMRFVLPSCMIAVYTSSPSSPSSFAYHLAGTNCMLLKGSTHAHLIGGIRRSLATGCWTDPGFGLTNGA